MQRDLTPHAPPSRFRSLRRGLVGGLATLTLVAGFGVVTNVAADAKTVQYTVDFEPPAVAVGGVSASYLDCEDDIGGTAAISVVAPDASVVSATQVIGSYRPDLPDRVYVQAGPGHLVNTNVPGTWTLTVTCPTYDPFTTTLEVLVPTLTVSGRLDSDYDCTTTDDYFGVGTDSNVCLTVTNTTGQDVSRIGWTSPFGASFQYPAPGEFPAGTTRTSRVGGGGILPEGGGVIEGLMVWVEVGAPYSGNFAASDIVSVQTPVLPNPLALTVTTGLDPASACADTGGVDWRDSGVTEVEVYVCYHVTNQAGVDLIAHGLHDSVLGQLFTGKDIELEPLETYDWVTPSPVTVSADTVFSATWTAEPDDYYSSLPLDWTATADGSATVLVSDPTVPTTTPPTTTPPTTEPTVPPTTVVPTFEPVVGGKVETTTIKTEYVAVQANPAFTG